MDRPTSLKDLTAAQQQQFATIAGRYEKAWQTAAAGAPPPDLMKFLPSADNALRTAILRELVVIDLEARWQRNEPVYLEQYLKRYPELGSVRRLPVELIYEEFRHRHLYGDRPPVASYQSRFREQFTDLKQLVDEQGTLMRPEATPYAPQPSPAAPASAGVLPSEVLPPTAEGNVLPIGGGYKLLKRLGVGSFGEVWRAEAPGGIDAAVKIIRRTLDSEEAQRERQALELVKRLRHPFLLLTHAYFAFADRLLIVMELADGSLRDRLKQCRRAGHEGIPQGELLVYFSDAAEALDFLHQENVHHRDIKPDNILLLQGHAKVADMGLARLQDSESLAQATATGSPAYMAPEVWRGQISPNSDQYSLATAYAELRLGRPVFESKQIPALMTQILNDEPKLDPLPEAEQKVLRNALAKVPDQRYPDCRTFVRALKEARLSELRKQNKSVARRLPKTDPEISDIETTPGPGTDASLASLHLGALAAAADTDNGSSSGAKTPRVQEWARPVSPVGNKHWPWVLAIGLVAAFGVPVAHYFVSRPSTAPAANPARPSLHLVQPEPLRVANGHEAQLTLKLEREDFTGPVKLSFSGWPPQTEQLPNELTVPAGDDSISVPVQLGLGAPSGSRTVSITAEGDGQRDHVNLELTVIGLPSGYEPVPAKEGTAADNVRFFSHQFPGWDGPRVVEEAEDQDKRRFFKHIVCRLPNHPGIDFVLIPKGLPSKAQRQVDTRSYYIMVNKVAVGDFQQFATHDSNKVKAAQRWKEDLTKVARKPVMDVTVLEAHEFAKWLGGLLPTTVQWDKAAGRFQEKQIRGEGPYQGEWDPGKPLHIAVNRTKQTLLDVGEARHDWVTFSGCRDMGGNGLEWTRDLGNRVGVVGDGELLLYDKVQLRGMGWGDREPLMFKELDNPDSDRVAAFGSEGGTASSERIGFRVVLEP
jgi:serine/threonine protein kinase